MVAHCGHPLIVWGTPGDSAQRGGYLSNRRVSARARRARRRRVPFFSGSCVPKESPCLTFIAADVWSSRTQRRF